MLNAVNKIYYTGVISEVLDRNLYKVKVDIPCLNKGMVAFPMRGEIDEPKVGDLVLVLNMDPLFSSYMLYSKLKENDFVGIRSNGKMIDITSDYISIGIFDKDTKYDEENSRPKLTDWVKIDKDGNLDIKTRGGITINIEGDTELNVKGNVKVDSPNVEVTGGNLKVNGNVTPNPNGGPFNCIPICPFSGATHIGNKVSGT